MNKQHFLIVTSSIGEHIVLKSSIERISSCDLRQNEKVKTKIVLSNGVELYSTESAISIYNKL